VKSNQPVQTEKIVLVAIICLTVLEVVALMKGINGTLLTMVIALIAGLSGWITPIPKWKKR